MTENIKNTAIPAAGYIYQNRQGLKVLCDWLDAPERYIRVKFECDEECDAPQGLDDIVIERGDGLIELQQVKFTPNPDEHLLSWDWLLKKTGTTARSRSMLRKWFDAFMQLDHMKIGEISLKTNRRPDAAMESCLEDGRFSFFRIAEPERSKVIAELGSAENCESFFDQLRVYHSDKGYCALEYDVTDRIRPYGTPEGIANLKNIAVDWAILKNFPSPDGWITLEMIRAILQASPPAPLAEDFVVPEGYEVPDEAFHYEFIKLITSGAKSVIVLTGPPGRGKSTYLSALCDTLAEDSVPTARHHYFFSITERGGDRVHSYQVEQSIRAQIERFHGDIPKISGGLRPLLEACASYYKTYGKPFVLILDGLDHVWRINSEDRQPLDDLFRQVIPCPDNMVLLVGTQPVDDAQLPLDLLASASRDEWHVLPTMSENAVLSYLRRIVQEGRLTTGYEGEMQAEEQLQGAASALCARTSGHPLHIIYAIAELEHSRRKLSAWDIEHLAGDLSKDAKFYYASLWEGLLPSLKDTLRLICAFSFFWPRSAFAEISAAIKAREPDVEKIEHLLHSSRAGLKIFHESLAVFVRATDGYETRVNDLTPAVASWLEHSAPPSLRVNWLWTIQAKMGEPSNLITGLTRDWIMNRLCEGYPETLFDTLLSESLTAALETAAFADAYRLGHLKDRMVGGSRYQMSNDDLARLISFTLTLTAEESVIHEAIASRHELDILHVAALGLALCARGEKISAKICGKEALRRFRGLSRFSSRFRSRTDLDEVYFLAGACARVGVIGHVPCELIELICNNSPQIWLSHVQMLVDEGSLDDLMVVAAAIENVEKKRIISDGCVRAAVEAGVRIADRDDFDTLARTPLVAAVEAALTQSAKPLNKPTPVDWLKNDLHERKECLAELAHHWFFSTVHLSLCMAAEKQTSFEYIPAPVYEKRENITEFLDILSEFGIYASHKWFNSEFVDFHEVYAFFESMRLRSVRETYDQNSAAKDFLAALHRIACDIRLVSNLVGDINAVPLTIETIRQALQYTWFDSASFLAQYAAGSLTKMTDEAAAAFIRSQRLYLDTKVLGETCVHLLTPLQLCAIAITHNLRPEAHELCRQSWEITTGYGHRKDPTLGNTIDAIGYLVDVIPEAARRLLSQIAPQVHSVLEYTDGSGTRHVLSAADRLLARLRPSALVAKYQEHIHAGDWASAEDSLQAYIEQGVTEGWPLGALMRTGLQPQIHDLLQQLSRDGNVNAAEQLRILKEHSGLESGLMHSEDQIDNDLDGKPYEGDVTTFGPDQLESLLKELSASYSERLRFLREWYQYWDLQRQGTRLLAEFDKVFFSEKPYSRDVLALADLAFHTKRKVSGVGAAWKYLVHAQIRNGGWIGYVENPENTCRRLDLIARYYPKRCDEFVIKTTYGMFDKPVPQRLAPSESMVYFFIKQNRIAEAIKFVEAMVHCVIDDTRTLPLKQPRWMVELFPHGNLETQ